jgi:hypothetical protein
MATSYGGDRGMGRRREPDKKAKSRWGEREKLRPGAKDQEERSNKDYPEPPLEWDTTQSSTRPPDRKYGSKADGYPSRNSRERQKALQDSRER